MKRPLHSRLVLQPVDPRRQRLRAVAAVSAVLLAIVLAFVVTRQYTLGHYQTQIAQSDELRERLQRVRAERDMLERRLALSQRNEQITRRSNEELREAISHLQRRFSGLEDENEFFRDLARASADQRQLAVHQVAVFPGSREDRLRLRIALTQGLEQSEAVRGWLELEVEGEQAGAQQFLAFQDLSVDGQAAHLEFHFRYFQQIIQEVHLPKGFEPRQLTVILTDDDEGVPGRERLRRVYDWQDIQQGDA